VTTCLKDSKVCGDGKTVLYRDLSNNCEFSNCPAIAESEIPVSDICAALSAVQMCGDSADCSARTGSCYCTEPGYLLGFPTLLSSESNAAPKVEYDCSPPKVEFVYEWRVGRWGECSSKCGGGERSRTASCSALRLSTGERTEAPDAKCVLSKQPITGNTCNPAKCGDKVGYASLRLVATSSFDALEASSTLHFEFVESARVSVARSLAIALNRVSVVSLASANKETITSRNRLRRLSEAEGEEVFVNFAIAPAEEAENTAEAEATQTVTETKSVEECMEELTEQAQNPESPLLTDSFIKKHTVASSSVQPASMLAVTTVNAGEQAATNDVFESLQSLQGETASSSGDGGGGISITSVLGAVVGGVLAIAAAVLFASLKSGNEPNDDKAGAKRNEGAHSSPVEPSVLHSNPMNNEVGLSMEEQYGNLQVEHL